MDQKDQTYPLLKRIGGYLVFSKGLGVGSYAQTALAQKEEEAHYIACKIIEKQKVLGAREALMKYRLQAEVETWRAMIHENIVRFIDLRESKKNIYMFMEYCSNGTLEQLLKKQWKLDEQNAVVLFKQMAKGCLYLYEQNVVHRDLKPSNILFDNNNVLKIADFGFAKFLESESKDLQSDLTSYIGTPIYMSPQVFERTNYSIKTDIWSLGIIFYEVLVGVTPDHFLSNLQGIAQVNSETLVFPKLKISKQMRSLIKSMLLRDEEKRISIQSLVEELEKFNEEFYSQKDENVEKIEKKLKV